MILHRDKFYYLYLDGGIISSFRLRDASERDLPVAFNQKRLLVESAISARAANEREKGFAIASFYSLLCRYPFPDDPDTANVVLDAPPDVIATILLSFGHKQYYKRNTGPAAVVSEPEKPAAPAISWPGPSLLTMISTALMFPPFGGVMMALNCNARDIEQADWFLGFLVPLYGLIKFWNC